MAWMTLSHGEACSWRRSISTIGPPGSVRPRPISSIFHGGPIVEKLRRDGALSIEIIEGPDHTFTPLWSHPVLTSTLGAQFDDLPRGPG